MITYDMPILMSVSVLTVISEHSRSFGLESNDFYRSYTEKTKKKHKARKYTNPTTAITSGVAFREYLLFNKNGLHHLERSQSSHYHWPLNV